MISMFACSFFHIFTQIFTSRMAQTQNQTHGILVVFIFSLNLQNYVQHLSECILCVKQTLRAPISRDTRKLSLHEIMLNSCDNFINITPLSGRMNTNRICEETFPDIYAPNTLKDTTYLS